MERLRQLWELPIVQQSVEIWLSGGWAMIALAVNALILFGIGFRLWIRLRTQARSMPERKWRRWIDHPQERRGQVGELIE
ncbi:MAG TPA: hypothetical protein VD788_15185, partial [Candidatus Polarisedimenticolaceae bacterium]|nr:hypothetical protein [Candidatus Polarisedimenticolaceae bacterium]